MRTDRQTDRQNDKPSTVTLAAHARRGLIREGLWPMCSPLHSSILSLYQPHPARGVVLSASLFLLSPLLLTANWTIASVMCCVLWCAPCAVCYDVHHVLWAMMCTMCCGLWCAPCAVCYDVHHVLCAMMCTMCCVLWCAPCAVCYDVHHLLCAMMCTMCCGLWCAPCAVCYDLHHVLWAMMCTMCCLLSCIPRHVRCAKMHSQTCALC